MLERVLEARRRVLGEEHPDTLTSLNDLGIVYMNQGKLVESTDLLEKVVESR